MSDVCPRMWLIITASAPGSFAAKSAMSMR